MGTLLASDLVFIFLDFSDQHKRVNGTFKQQCLTCLFATYFA